MARKIVLWLSAAALVAAFVGVLASRVGGRAALRVDVTWGALALRDVLFYGLAALTTAGAAAVAFSRDIVYSALGLLFALLGTGALYVFLSADFLAVTQLLVYVGGVLVLILFAVMLTSRIGEVRVSNTSLGLAGGLALLLATVPPLVFAALTTPWAVRPSPALVHTTRAIGHGFLSRWLLPFELASIVLLATLVGAVVIARGEIEADGSTR